MPIVRRKSHKTRTSWIYLLIDPRDKAIRYVGHAFKPKSRFASHCRGCGGNPKVSEWIRELEATGHEPIMVIAGKVTTYTGDWKIDDRIRRGAETNLISRLDRHPDSTILNVAHTRRGNFQKKQRTH